MRAGFLALCESLDEAKLQYTRPPDEPVVFVRFQRPAGRVDAIVQWHPGDVVEWAMAWPFLVPPHRDTAVMQALVTVNMMLHVGRFDFDVPNRRLVFRAFHVALDQNMSQSQVEFFVSSGLFVFDQLYLPLQDVCLRDGDPASPAATLRHATGGQL